jgi:hypothetical protein
VGSALGCVVGVFVLPISAGASEGSIVSPTLLGLKVGTLVGLTVLGLSDTGASEGSGSIVGLM